MFFRLGRRCSCRRIPDRYRTVIRESQVPDTGAWRPCGVRVGHASGGVGSRYTRAPSHVRWCGAAGACKVPSQATPYSARRLVWPLELRDVCCMYICTYVHRYYAVRPTSQHIHAMQFVLTYTRATSMAPGAQPVRRRPPGTKAELGESGRKIDGARAAEGSDEHPSGAPGSHRAR